MLTLPMSCEQAPWWKNKGGTLYSRLGLLAMQALALAKAKGLGRCEAWAKEVGEAQG